MQYKELIQFEPITTVVKLVSAGEQSIAENLVKTFVFSKKMQEDLKWIFRSNSPLKIALYSPLIFDCHS